MYSILPACPVFRLLEERGESLVQAGHPTAVFSGKNGDLELSKLSSKNLRLGQQYR